MSKGTNKKSNTLLLAYKKMSAGNEAAFEYLFKELYPYLYSYVLNYVSDKQIAEEIIQDVFLNLWEKRQSIEIHDSPRAYMYTSTRNRALNYLRAQKKMLISDTASDLEQLHQIEQLPQVEAQLSEVELEAIAAQAIAALPHRCRLIFSLSRYEFMSYQEIATHLNLSVKTVERQMSIALKKLKSTLGPYLENT